MVVYIKSTYASLYYFDAILRHKVYYLGEKGYISNGPNNLKFMRVINLLQINIKIYVTVLVGASRQLNLFEPLDN